MPKHKFYVVSVWDGSLQMSEKCSCDFVFTIEKYAKDAAELFNGYDRARGYDYRTRYAVSATSEDKAIEIALTKHRGL